MRSVILATSVALALGSASAIAQTGLPRVTASTTTGPSTATPTTSSATTAPRATAAPSASSLGTSSVATATPATGAGTTAFGANTTTSIPTNSAPSFAPGGPFSGDSGNTALGTSPGQTSSGTAAGNSSAGLGAGSATLDPAANGAPGAGTIATNGALLGAGVNVERVLIPSNVVNQPASALSVVDTPTPTLDEAAREGRGRENARKARGQEARVYGIAPRTENDLTWQMPDDRIIRY